MPKNDSDEEKPPAPKTQPVKLKTAAFEKSAQEEPPKEEPKPAPKKLAQPNWMDDDSDGSDDALKRSKTEPVVKRAEPKAEGEGDDFKNTLAAMLARGPMGKPAPKKKPEPVVEEQKEKIKLNVWDDDADEEEEKVKQMAQRDEDEDLPVVA